MYASHNYNSNYGVHDVNTKLFIFSHFCETLHNWSFYDVMDAVVIRSHTYTSEPNDVQGETMAVGQQVTG